MFIENDNQKKRELHFNIIHHLEFMKNEQNKKKLQALIICTLDFRNTHSNICQS